jgi:hypothetical protein
VLIGIGVVDCKLPLPWTSEEEDVDSSSDEEPPIDTCVSIEVAETWEDATADVSRMGNEVVAPDSCTKDVPNVDCCEGAGTILP